ncbi:MAG: L-serine ammonia-lyase, partial [Acidobacteria bacterium]|nr:L-serine ammonia-lyase [Acidobacteriota bacterium]
MAVSVFDLFSIGIGPSSSHTVGPMRAARMFVERLRREGKLAAVTRLQVELYGSLALTGKGHGTDRAVLLGLEGETPEGVDPDTVEDRLAALEKRGALKIPKGPTVPFEEARDLVFRRRETLPAHPNGMRFSAWGGGEEEPLERRVYYSIGGGFV